jgi:hypothetical protein
VNYDANQIVTTLLGDVQRSSEVKSGAPNFCHDAMSVAPAASSPLYRARYREIWILPQVQALTTKLSHVVLYALSTVMSLVGWGCCPRAAIPS